MPDPEAANDDSLLRVGVIGLGVGEQHLVSYESIPGCKVVSVCDIDPTRLRDVGERYGIAGQHTDYRKVTEDPDVDVISICSYDDVHAEQAISSLRHGKHVMIEKPIALRRSDAEQLVAVHQESGRILTSNLILRASPRFRELRQSIAAGELGEVFYIEGDYIHQILHKVTHGWRGKLDEYSVIHGGGVHLVDLMRWLVGREVAEVCAMGSKVLTAGSAYPHEDTAVALLRFENGALAKNLTTFGPQRTKFHALNVYGTAGTFVNDLPTAKRFRGTAPADEEVVATPYPGMEKGDLLPDFVTAIRSGREPDVTARDVFRVMDVCFAIVEAMRSGRTTAVRYLV
ncbi:MAG: Gfo/Idh/MocA family protein [Actinomycetota bacterium]